MPSGSPGSAARRCGTCWSATRRGGARPGLAPHPAGGAGAVGTGPDSKNRAAPLGTHTLWPQRSPTGPSRQAGNHPSRWGGPRRCPGPTPAGGKPVQARQCPGASGTDPNMRNITLFTPGGAPLPHTLLVINLTLKIGFEVPGLAQDARPASWDDVASGPGPRLPRPTSPVWPIPPGPGPTDGSATRLGRSADGPIG